MSSHSQSIFAGDLNGLNLGVSQGRCVHAMLTPDTEKLLTAYRIIGTKWTIHILCALSQGPKNSAKFTKMYLPSQKRSSPND